MPALSHVLPTHNRHSDSIPFFNSQFCVLATFLPTYSTHTPHRHPFLPSFIQQTCDSPDSVLGAGDTTVNKVDEDLAFMNLIF